MEQPGEQGMTDGRLRHPPPAPRAGGVARTGGRPSRRRMVGCLLLVVVLILAICVAPAVVAYRALFPPTGPRYSDKPRQVAGLRDVTAVAAGDRFSIALKSDGTVWSWGAGDFGRLGVAPRDKCQAKLAPNCQRDPVQVPLPRRAVAIAAGGQRAAAVTDDGAVLVWGSDEFGGLGDSPGPTERFRRLIRDGGGSFAYRVAPAQLPGLRDVMALAASDNHTLALTGAGAVWSWGEDFDVPTRLSIADPAILIATSSERSAAVTADGTLWEWRRFLPVRAGDLRGATALAAGADYTIAITRDGSAWFRGNGYGDELCQAQYGSWIGNLRCSSAQIRIADLPAVTGAVIRTPYQAAMLAVASDGQLWSWDNGWRPDPGSTSPGGLSVRAIGLGNVRAAASGRDHDLALKNDGTVWAWGDNAYGQLGR